MVLDPKYFLLHKPPFDKVDLKLKYSLTSKIEEEENIRKIFEKKKNSLSDEKKRNYSSKKRCVTASTRPINANNNINIISLNKKNFIFNQKKEIKFIHVPKNRIKKKTENRILKIFKEENNNSR